MVDRVCVDGVRKLRLAQWHQGVGQSLPRELAGQLPRERLAGANVVELMIVRHLLCLPILARLT